MAKRTKTISPCLEGCFLREIEFKGTVFSGTGEGRKFIALPWVKRQIEEELGFTPYAGTLNIRLTKESAKKERRLNEAEKFVIKPEEGYCTGILIKAKIKNLSCAFIIPQIPSYPQDELEVVAAWNLRERLSLSDGSAVSVDVTV
jgi:riboflavin kinase